MPLFALKTQMAYANIVMEAKDKADNNNCLFNPPDTAPAAVPTSRNAIE
jgi:hypothetical protein